MQLGAYLAIVNVAIGLRCETRHRESDEIHSQNGNHRKVSPIPKYLSESASPVSGVLLIVDILYQSL